MFLKIVVVGKTKEASFKSLESLYLKRISRYTKANLVAVRQEKLSKGQRASAALKVEAARIFQEIEGGDFCVVLDSRGREFTSRELANFLQQHLLSRRGRMVFVAGGPLGLADAVKKRADLLLSFSKFTFTHEMIRVLLLEQLYRFWTLMRGEKYHK